MLEAKWRLGYEVSVQEAQAVLQDSARQGKITITETRRGDVIVTSISAALRSKLQKAQD